MDFFHTVTGIIITVAGVLGALVTIFTILNNLVKHWIEKKKAQDALTKTMCDVKTEFSTFKQEIKEDNKVRDKLLAEMVQGNKDIKSIISLNEIDRIRWEILTFANLCRRQVRANLDEFTHIINLYQKYHALLDAEGRENGQIALEYEYISRLYMKLSENDQFEKE